MTAGKFYRHLANCCTVEQKINPLFLTEWVQATLKTLNEWRMCPNKYLQSRDACFKTWLKRGWSLQQDEYMKYTFMPIINAGLSFLCNFTLTFQDEIVSPRRCDSVEEYLLQSIQSNIKCSALQDMKFHRLQRIITPIIQHIQTDSYSISFLQ